MKFWQLYSSIFFENNDQIKNIKFLVIPPNKLDRELRIIIDGKNKFFKIKPEFDAEPLTEKINNYYHKSNSINKTLDLIKKFTDEIIINNNDNAPIDTNKILSNIKTVYCPECKLRMHWDSANRPGITCPHCQEGELEAE